MSKFEYSLFFLGIVFRLGAFSAFGQAYPLYYYSKLSVIGLSLVAAIIFFFMRFSLLLKIFRRHVPFFLMLIYAGISLSWNANSRWGFLDYLRNLDLLVFFLFLIYRFGESEILKIFKKAIHFILIASIITFLINPEIALWNTPGKEHFRIGFRGVMSTSGQLIALVNFLIILYFINPLTKKSKTIKSLSYFFLLLCCFIACSSVTSFFTMGLIFFLGVLFKYASKNKLRLMLYLGSALFASIFIFFLNSELKFLDNFFGRNFNSFSGRTEIWAAAFEAIKNRIVFGYGINGYCITAFLTGDECNFGSASDLADGFKLTASLGGWSAHNEIIVIILNYGLVGFALFLLLYFKFFSRIFSLKKLNSNLFIEFYFYFSVFLFLQSFFVAFFFSSINAHWILFLLTYFLVYHPRHDQVIGEIEQGDLEVAL